MIFTTVISMLYIQFRHTLLVKIQNNHRNCTIANTVTISKLESDGFRSSNLAIVLLIGIGIYTLSLLHLMVDNIS